jgi:transposase
MKPELKIKYRRYDEAFKRSAVEHWLVSGKPATHVAAELGINVQNLHKWKQKFKELPAGQVAGTLEALQAENRRLQRELQRVSVQRDILKKTWASSPNRPAAVCPDKRDAKRILHR